LAKQEKSLRGIARGTCSPRFCERIEFPAVKLDRLHLTCKRLWAGRTPASLRSARDTGWGLPNRTGLALDVRKARLIDVLEDTATKTLRYLYDFGDGWGHTIKIEPIAAPQTGRHLSASDRGGRPQPA
jgi:hypothetical protein